MKKAEQLSISMETVSRKLKFIESKTVIQRIRRLETEIQTCSNPQEFGRLNRDLKHFKSQSATDLSDLVSNRQQLLVGRLNIIQVWKSLIICEIHVMEEGKKILVHDIWKKLESVEDPSLREEIQTKLKTIDLDDITLPDTKIDQSAVRVANVDKLREMLVKQLDNVINIERAVVEKKKQFAELSRIFKEIKRQLPADESIPDPSTPAIPNKEIIDQQPNMEKEATKEKPQGMVIQGKHRNT